MCGIIGIVGVSPVADRLVESLRRLEYRGYDSAGVAVGAAGAAVEVRRAPGKLRNLEAVLRESPADGVTGIGHTRWATHGAPVERNAHPHRAGRVTLVHNGIIENFAELKRELEAQGRTFHSDTDSEVVAQLMDRALDGAEPLEALRQVLGRIRGAYALVVMIAGRPDLLLGARHGPPLVVGYGEGEMFLGSDAVAVGPFTHRLAYLEDGDHVALTREGVEIYDAADLPVERPVRIVPASAALAEKGEYRHFMEKEIHEQPDSCQHTLSAYLDPVTLRAQAPGGFGFEGVERLEIVACGTAFYAGLTARYLFERLAGLPVDVEIASEFRYRDPALAPGTLALAVSQSGETADTLAALKWCKAQGCATAALVNAHTSSMAREADHLWPTHAGAEIGVASTKAFTAQVCALTALAIAAARARGRIDAAEEARLVSILLEAPRLIGEAAAVEPQARALAHDLARARDVLYLGRGPAFPLAMEGALKLKEISYIHAEGYAAGELKHGPIALVDEETPVIVIAPSDALFEKTVSNMQEVQARGGPVILITDEAGAARVPPSTRTLLAPLCDPLIAPLVYAPAIQLLAYHVGVHKGLDVDQPRNLAKSVTVE